MASKTSNRVNALLGIQYPVIQAPMIWMTSARLVAAVSEAGGLGVLGPNAGQTTIITDPLETAERFRQEIRNTRKLTDKPFAVNFLLPMGEHVEGNNRFADPLLKVVVEEKVPIAVTVGIGIHRGIEYINRLKEAGIIIVHREISPTVANSIEAERAGIDALVITGQEAGGVLSQHAISTTVLLSQVLDVVKLPVIADGGIYDTRTASAAKAAGAEGVYAGTRFLLTTESRMAKNAKEAVIKARSEDLIKISTGGFGATVLPVCNYIPATAGGADVKLAMLEGNIDQGAICVSPSAGGINKILSAAEVVSQLAVPFIESDDSQG